MPNKFKSVPCDRKGRPIVPSDIGWRQALARALLFLALGAALLPAGLLLYGLLPLPDNAAAIKFAFGLSVFFGALFLLYGVVVAVIALAQRHGSPSPAELNRRAREEGVHCSATVKKVRVKTRKEAAGTVGYYRLSLEYADSRYKFTRRFDSGWQRGKAFSVGDKVDVYYHPDSNIGYFVDTGAEKTIRS